MFRNNRTTTYALIGIVGVAIALAVGFNPAFLLVLVICPLMMFFMMRSMGPMIGHDHTPEKNDRDGDRGDRDSNTGR